MLTKGKIDKEEIRAKKPRQHGIVDRQCRKFCPGPKFTIEMEVGAKDKKAQTLRCTVRKRNRDCHPPCSRTFGSAWEFGITFCRAAGITNDAVFRHQALSGMRAERAARGASASKGSTYRVRYLRCGVTLSPHKIQPWPREPH